ncbi:hypothetical protein CHS0354_029108 [Potamilus streckersoni]|uniref:Rab3 GTPase-activating protein non-catalytic subunit n=1 Tax=Potamilus streckersoni TaxID=2493646 RepID=A0AAE0SWZ5_9BIVA|nr:hypothetical protein CHS0354_029108 [Potamilus streckersoni]
MSCQLIPLSHFGNIDSVRDFLFPSPMQQELVKKSKVKETGWDESWGDNWDEAMQQDDESGNVSEGHNDENDDTRNKWLQDCHLSLSPANDLIAVAYLDKMVILANKYDPEIKYKEYETNFSTVWEGSVKQEEREMITAILCLPLASQKRSTHGGPDWTCVIVGFSTGYIRMYTETGALLLSQQLHAEPVQKMKCHTYEPPRYLGLGEQHEELVILYKRAIVAVDGFSLFQALKACRNQVARASASGESTLQPPPLAYKKWGPQEQESIQDFYSCGVCMANSFDVMVTASVIGGQNPVIRSSGPVANMYITAGNGPFVGFFYAIEGFAPPMLSDVAYAVASKLKSAIMSAARYGLPDQRRQGTSISLSPNGNYAATTDSFGRVILIDVEQGVAFRMWKGYRDAQVGWIQVYEEESASGRTRYGHVAQFLVIYAARRGLLEVWLAGSGPRVAAFNVSKWGCLICPPHGILGLNNVTCKGVKIKEFQCALVDIDGSILKVDVPFHLALSDKNSRRVRDLHLLKQIKFTLRENKKEPGTFCIKIDALETKVKDFLLNIRTANIAQQAVERILSTKYLGPAVQGRILEACILKLSSLGGSNLEIDRRLFLQFCRLNEHLVNTFVALEKFNKEKNVKEGPAPTACQVLTETIGLGESEAMHILSQFQSCDRFGQNKPETELQFQHETMVYDVSSFLSCIECTVHVQEQEPSLQGSSAISLVKNLPEDKRSDLGEFLFEWCLSGNGSVSELGRLLLDSRLPSEETATLLVQQWLAKDNRSIESMAEFFNLLKTFTSLIDSSRLVAVDSNIPSPWWQKFRDMCAKSQNNRAAYMAAVVGQVVAIETINRLSLLSTSSGSKDHDTSSASSDASEKFSLQDWETVTVDMEYWERIIKHLEDCLILSCLMKRKPHSPYFREDRNEEIRISVSGLLEGGKGCITEAIAKYVARAGLKPEDLYRPVREETQKEGKSTQLEEQIETDEIPEKSVQKKIWDLIADLRQRFPHSLENDVLFSNCCWEYTVLWNKEPEEVDCLKTSLDFLKLVQNAVLRHGVAFMMWHMFVSKRFQITALLMDKVGRVPKDRLCRKDVGISENRLPDFVGQVVQLIQLMMEANCEMNEVPVFNIEHAWHYGKGSVSLVELAVDKKVTNYHLIKHHHHLALMMHAILILKIKSWKVLSLFDTRGRNAFFVDLYSHPYLPNKNVDLAVSAGRTQFFTKLITRVVITLLNSITAADCPEFPTYSLSKLRSSPVNKWPYIVLDLAHEFGLDIDFIKRHHVCELYSAGLDKLAEEVLLTVNDHESIGSELLQIVRLRIQYQFSICSNRKMLQVIPCVDPYVSGWLKRKSSGELIRPDVPVSLTCLLLSNVINQLREGHPEHELAVSLVDLLEMFQLY